MTPGKEHRTAILIFARSAEQERRHKKIRHGKSLFTALTQHVLGEVRKTGLPYFHIDETRQKGFSFGQRFSNAIQRIFESGYDQVITVGNDSPHLNRDHIEQAVARLRNTPLVIGPSLDGGFYLMGLHRKYFNGADFETLSWQTATIRKEVIALILPRGRKASVLPQLSDIDSVYDVFSVAESTLKTSQRVLEVIRAIVTKAENIDKGQTFFSKTVVWAIPFNKGSPIPSIL